MEETGFWVWVIVVGVPLLAGAGVAGWEAAYVWAKKVGSDKWVRRLERVRGIYLKVKPIYRKIAQRVARR